MRPQGILFPASFQTCCPGWFWEAQGAPRGPIGCLEWSPRGYPMACKKTPKWNPRVVYNTCCHCSRTPCRRYSRTPCTRSPDHHTPGPPDHQHGTVAGFAKQLDKRSTRFRTPRTDEDDMIPACLATCTAVRGFTQLQAYISIPLSFCTLVPLI